MPTAGSTTILRGFKVSVAAFDAFLAANHVDGTDGAPPFYYHHPDKDPISKLLYEKITAAGGTASKDKFRAMIPSREGHDDSKVVYVTYAWITIYAHLELRMDHDLPVEVPTGFEELRKEILSFADGIPDSDKIPDEGRMGLFVVYTDDIRGLYNPQELVDRFTLPQRCDQCDAVFDVGPTSFYKRQEHRREVHGSKEGPSPLPYA